MNFRELVVDLNENNVNDLSNIIKECIIQNINLIVYSSKTMKNPNISITKIPDLTSLFVRAVLLHGLLAYLDLKVKEKPESQYKTILDNVIIITCGTEIENGIHEIDENKLNFLRTKSEERFKQIIKIDNEM